MLKKGEVRMIHKMLRDGLSKSAIARKLGIHRDTVAKYAGMPEGYVPEINLSREPNQKNHDDKMNYKRDLSLNGDRGREITTPICSLEELKEYIEKIAKLIDDNGETNEDTGFHIHMSTKLKIAKVDFYRFMLLADDKSLLTNWGGRNGYSLNVMDILDTLEMEEARKFKNKKGRIWNLEKRDEEHIEIRTMGGSQYQRKTEQIFDELDAFVDIFKKALNRPDTDYILILKAHMKKLKTCDSDRKQKFLEVINRSIKS